MKKLIIGLIGLVILFSVTIGHTARENIEGGAGIYWSVTKAALNSNFVELYAIGGLEEVTEGGKTGWRLIGSNPANYGDIGLEAVDLSYGNVVSTTRGATGSYSFASGAEVTASGLASAAGGYRCEANGDYSWAFGTGVKADGDYSHAVGNGTLASGNYSTAEGRDTTASNQLAHAEGMDTVASGLASHAEGNGTTASGQAAHSEGEDTIASGDFSHVEGYDTVASTNYSHAEGYGTIALNLASHAAGTYNIGTSTDTIHETGIGPNEMDKKNAFEIYMDGSILAPEFSNAEIDSRGATALITKNYFDTYLGDVVDAVTITGTSPTLIFMESDSTNANTYFTNNISTFGIYTANDAGTPTATLLTIMHATGQVNIPNALSVSGNIIVGGLVDGRDIALDASRNIVNVTIQSPGATEDYSANFVNRATTISECRAVLLGSSTPSVTWTVRHGTDRSATGAEVVTSGTTTTSITTGSDVTAFDDATIVADSFIWLETSAQSGTVDELHVTCIGTAD